MHFTVCLGVSKKWVECVDVFIHFLNSLLILVGLALDEFTHIKLEPNTPIFPDADNFMFAFVILCEENIIHARAAFDLHLYIVQYHMAMVIVVMVSVWKHPRLIVLVLRLNRRLPLGCILSIIIRCLTSTMFRLPATPNIDAELLQTI